MKLTNLLLSAALISAAASSQTKTTGSTSYSSGSNNARRIMQVSENGNYAVGNDAGTTAVFWNLTDASDAVAIASDEDTDAQDVTNQGVAVGSKGNYAAIYKNGEWITYPNPETYNYAFFTACSADGKILGGKAARNDNSCNAAIYTEEGWTILPTPGFLSRGDEISNSGVMDISADGNVILGYVDNNFGETFGIIWKYPFVEYSVFADDMLDDFNDAAFEYSGNKPVCCYTAETISGNGKWVTGGVKLSNKIQTDNYSYRYDVENGTFETIEDIVTYNGGKTIDNNGVIYTAVNETGDPMVGRMTYIQKPGATSTAITDYLPTVSTAEFTALTTSNTPMDVDAAGNVIVGFGLNENAASLGFVIKYDDKSASVNSSKLNYANVYVSDGKLIIEGKADLIRIYSIGGELVKEISAAEGTVSLDGLENGIYVSKVVSEGKVISSKFSRF